jgi:alkanesulfonate monooxygenase SsuD/methylene tetrahydromethanopterin reductase-like flavin-dependent oxidoreductase (luciferase family)
VRFGIFFEHQLPRPWGDGDEQRLLKEALEQAELADQLGYDYIWEVEHHFLEEYSHSSAPEVFLGAVSQRTSNIRLGHGIMQTAPQYNHPARVAERISTLDLISGGRVEFGSGESGTLVELGGFGIDREEKRAAWREGLEVAVRCMTEAPFTGVDGTYVKMPARNVVPKPSQKPHPPLWLACSRRDTILLAAELGMGALSFAFMDPEAAREWVVDYEAALDRCVPIGWTVNHELASCLPMMCHEEETVALERGLEGANFFGYALGHYHAFGDHKPGVTNVWEEYQAKRSEVGYDPSVSLARAQKTLGAKLKAGETTAGLRGAVGTPDQLRAFMLHYEQVGVDQMIFNLQAGKNSHEHICEALELFGKKVLPEFKDRDDKQRAEKAKRLEPVVERALARREKAVSEGADEVVEPVFREIFKSIGGDEMIEKIAAASATGGAGGIIDILQVEDRIRRGEKPLG